MCAWYGGGTVIGVRDAGNAQEWWLGHWGKLCTDIGTVIGVSSGM